MAKMKREVEHRTLPSEQLRAEGPDDAPTKIAGYAAVFNSIAHGERVAPGAFKKTLQEQRDIRAFWGHDPNQPLARSSNGTLTLREDEHGLMVEMTPNLATSWGRDAIASVARGDVSQMSFGFRVIQSGDETVDGAPVRVLREVALHEVSLVSQPWYEATSAVARDEDGEHVDEEVAAQSESDAFTDGRSTEAKARARNMRARTLQLLQLGGSL